jgi:menaquinol-cytochrome c reductase iron-sulfur subunit
MSPGLTRRELAAVALAAAAAPLAACGEDGWQEVATADELIEGEFVRAEYVFDPDAGELGRLGLLVRQEGEAVLALREACPHQGCPVRYVAASERFICPCHGAIFDARGRVEAGPAQRPLERWPARLTDGRVEVQRRA